MAQDITSHDASTDLVSSTFEAPKASKLIVSIKWTDIDGGGNPKYFFKHSNIDAVSGDPVPSIPSGISISNGTDNATFEVLSPAKKFEHSYDASTVSAGTLEINTKIIYSND